LILETRLLSTPTPVHPGKERVESALWADPSALAERTLHTPVNRRRGSSFRSAACCCWEKRVFTLAAPCHAWRPL